MRFFAILILGLTLWLAPARAEDKPTAFEQVVKSGTIRCGYATWYPELIKDPNTGVLSGYDYDVVEMIGQVLGLKIEWSEEVAWGNAQTGLVAGRYDMACNGFWGPASRSKVVLLAQPFAFHPLYTVVRKDIAISGKGYTWLNAAKYRMAVMRGTMDDLIGKTIFPAARSLDAAELSNDGDMLMDVASGKADFAVSNLPPIERFLKDNPGALQVIDMPVTVAPSTLLLPGDDYRFKNMIDSALQFLINTGEIAKIIRKYEGNNPKAWLPPAMPYQEAP